MGGSERVPIGSIIKFSYLMCKEVSFYNVTIWTFDALISKAKLKQTLDAM